MRLSNNDRIMIGNFPANKEDEEAIKRGSLEGNLFRLIRECREEFGDFQTAQFIKEEFETIISIYGLTNSNNEVRR